MRARDVLKKTREKVQHYDEKKFQKQLYLCKAKGTSYTPTVITGKYDKFKKNLSTLKEVEHNIKETRDKEGYFLDELSNTSQEELFNDLYLLKVKRKTYNH